MRTLIKNGLVYDGSGGTPFRKDVLIKDGFIEAVTESAEAYGMEMTRAEASGAEAAAAEVMDASGLVVTPGFIDTHRHCDIDALYNPEFGRLEMAQGLTTVIGGNCGLAPIPAPKQYRRDIYDFIEPCLGIAPEEMAIERFGASASCGQLACDRDVEGGDQGIWERSVYQTGDGPGESLYP